MMLTGTGGLHSFVQFITVLILFLFVLFVTYFVTRWISGFQKAQMTGTNMEMIDTLRISPNKYLQIIRTGDKYLVIAVCKDSVTMLTELSKDSLSFDANRGGGMSFQEVLQQMKNNTKVLKDTTETEK